MIYINIDYCFKETDWFRLCEPEAQTHSSLKHRKANRVELLAEYVNIYDAVE